METLQASIISYIENKPEASLDYPFDDRTAVYKIAGKMFALCSQVSGVMRINLKCDPVQAQELRSIFTAVEPGYHMNKKHWNSVWLDGSLPLGELERMVDHSYSLVVRGLSKAQRERLALTFTHAELHGAAM